MLEPSDRIRLRNDDIWRTGPTTVSPGSPLRSYPFWHQHLLLDYGLYLDLDDHDAIWLPKSWLPDRWSMRFPFNVDVDPASSALAQLFFVEMTSGPGESDISIERISMRNGGLEQEGGQLGFWDRAHHLPWTLRWVELRAIVDYLEHRGHAPTPASPSLATLLLAPFTTITTDDEPERCAAELTTELEGLGLLSDREIRYAVDLSIMPDPIHWKPDHSVGWTLDRGAQRATKIPYSLRGQDVDFPAELLLDLLRRVGVDDFPQ